jgi:hypothetical protein
MPVRQVDVILSEAELQALGRKVIYITACSSGLPMLGRMQADIHSCCYHEAVNKRKESTRLALHASDSFKRQCFALQQSKCMRIDPRLLLPAQCVSHMGVR